MFNKISAFLMVLIFCAGCAGITTNGNQDKLVIVKSVARIVGYKIVARDKNLTDPVKLFCKSLSTGEMNQAIADSVRAFLTDKFRDDPLMVASISDLLGLIQIKTAAGASLYDADLVKAAAAGILEGVQLYEGLPVPIHQGAMGG